MTGEPLGARCTVPVAGAALAVARADAPADEAVAVVLARHGVASSHVVWRTVAVT